jgi:hypothetical protein
VTTGAGKNAKTTTKQTRVWAHVGEAQIRWESAEPLLAATARVDDRLHKAMAVLAKEYHLISVGGFVLPKGKRFRRVGERRARAERAADRQPPGGLQFPRDLALEEAGKGIDLRVQIGETRVIARFEPKQMGFQGQPAL